MLYIEVLTDRKFYFAWLVSALAMFGLSYAWHGIILNDLIRLSYPEGVYLTFSALVYLAVGFIVALSTLLVPSGRNSYKFGLLIGMVVGLFLYLVTLVLGVSFNPEVGWRTFLFDGGWQMVEQSLGGLICGLVYRRLFLWQKRANTDWD